jgi:oxygen-dependent protoporphyrinogen oxidase
LPAYIASGVFGELDQTLAGRLNSIYYPPVMVLYLGYNKKDIKRKLDGFGFLIPSKEKKHFLGAIWSSSIFPNRSPEDKAAFTLFIGGARSPHLFDTDKSELIKKVLSEFHRIMNIKGEPVLIENKLWQKAIPQYNLGYIEHEKYFEVFEEKHKGIYLRGNYRGGISVGDCIKNSELEIK